MTGPTACRLGTVMVAIGALGALDCGPGSTPPQAQSGPLPPGMVARVGGRAIDVGAVTRIARAQGVTLVEARRIAIHDALLAREAEARGLSEAAGTRMAWDGELARRFLRKLLTEARATPPTDAEVAAATARRWLEVDRPEGFRTVHAVVRYEQKDDDAKKARARKLAEALREAAAKVAARAPPLAPVEEGAPERLGTDPMDPLVVAFRQAVAAVPTEGLEVVAEPLPAITAAGRVLAPGGEQLFDPDFARAAAALPERGALSPLTESAFGMHVVLLLERTPRQVLEGDVRLARLRDDIVNDRARAAQKQILTGLRARRSVTPDAPGLLNLVGVDP